MQKLSCTAVNNNNEPVTMNVAIAAIITDDHSTDQKTNSVHAYVLYLTYMMIIILLGYFPSIFEYFRTQSVLWLLKAEQGQVTIHSEDMVSDDFAQESHRLRKLEHLDPILNDESNSRYVIFPIMYKDIFDLYKKAQASAWVASEIDLSKDKHEWNTKLTVHEQTFLKNVLAFFANSDGIVSDNLITRFYGDVKIPEARLFFSAQISIEAIHSESYSLMITDLISDKQEQTRLFNAIQEIDCVKHKAQWAQKWLASDMCFAARLVAFISVEGIGFSGSFCSIGILKSRGIMSGLCYANDKIAADEALHCQHMCLLYRRLKHKLSPEFVKEIILGAVQVEEEYIHDAIPVAIIGISSTLMIQYIHFIADVILGYLEIPPHFNVKNPFSFMNLFSIDGISQFFEKRVPEYAKTSIQSLNQEINFNTMF